MQVAFGVFANAKIQCEESVSSRTPQNLANGFGGSKSTKHIHKYEI